MFFCSDGVFICFFEDNMEVLRTQTIGRDFELENEHVEVQWLFSDGFDLS